ncbi:MAG: hypothetical protein NT070_02605 [Cyanobacteria bacterium]|nr:hypothetical protein [Cyanobacteriota bacterium]
MIQLSRQGGAVADGTAALSLSTSAPVGAIGLDKNPLALATSQPSKSVLFIDAGGTDSEQLAAGAAAGTQVYRLTAGDAVDQITQVLAGMHDVTQGEDASRIRVGTIPLIFTLARNLALNLYRSHGFTNMAQAQRQAGAGLGLLKTLFRMK